MQYWLINQILSLFADIYEKQYTEILAKFDNSTYSLMNNVTKGCNETIIWAQTGTRKQLKGKSVQNVKNICLNGFHRNTIIQDQPQKLKKIMTEDFLQG